MDNFRSRALRQRFGWRRDPKLAVRLGLARTGRVSQFLAADPIDTLDDRARAAVRDGFRQLGYLPARITFSLQSGLTLPDGLHVAAVWTVQVTRRKAFQPVYIPVVVVIPADRRQVLAWLPDGKTPALRPYRQALLDLTRLDPEAVRRSGRAKALTALQGFLTRDLPYSGVRELAVLVVAQNMRGTWKGLANKDIELDKVRFEERGAALPVASMAGRPRIIRLRDASEGQTPAWYLPGRTAGATAQGLCRADEDPGRTYYNIAAKSLSAGTRLVRSKQEDPTKRHVQQSILEIVPLAVQDPREVELCAVAVDQWRRMTYLMRKREMTLYPLPLRFAVKMDDYARVIGPWLLADEWDPEEDDPVADDDAEDLADDSSLS